MLTNNNGFDRRSFLKLGAQTSLYAAFASVIGGSQVTAKEILDNEKLKKVLDKIKSLLVLEIIKINKKLTSLEEVGNRVIEISNKILEILKEEGFSPKNTGNSQMDLISFFYNTGFVFAITPLEITPGKYTINFPIFEKLGKKEFDLGIFEIGNLDRSESKVSIFEAKKIVPDIREVVDFGNGKMNFDGLTISNPSNGNQEILIFPENLEKTGFSRKTVEINEASQIYFSEFIPVRGLGFKLIDLGISMPPGFTDITFAHVQEAFSDLASLKYGDEFDKEFERVLNSGANYQYKLTAEIAKASLLNFLKSKPTIRGRTYKEIRSKLSDSEFNELKEIVIGSYEANINILNLNAIKAALKSK